MSSELQDITLAKFFEFYKNDIESEVLDDSNVVLSFPVHFSGYQRIEVTVTRVAPEQFIISDGAKVLHGLRMAGYNMTPKLRERLEDISKAARVRIVNDHLISQSTLDQLGGSMQRFIEAAKSIGDAYLVQRTTVPRETELRNMVADFLASRQLPYQSRHQLRGAREEHRIDFYFPPNGVPGLALSVMVNPTHMAAQAWAFRYQDIKQTNKRTKVGVVYDDEDARKSSKSLLEGVADVSVPSSNISSLQDRLQSIGILKD